MSTEVIINPPTATKEDLRRHLLTLGFRKSSHFWEWPAGSLHFGWFEERDFQSIDGVEATIFPADDEIRADLGGGAWAVHTRVRASGSPFDKAKQNDTIRSIRKTFGGNFANDWFGRNRYNQIDPELRGPAGRGISACYEDIDDALRAVAYALPQPSATLNPPDGPTGVRKFIETINSQDRSRTVYNLVYPFSVAAFESFFRRVFIILITYDDGARRKLSEQERKIDLSDAMALSAGWTTLEKIVAGWYSFQNLDSLQKAYWDWLSINIRKMLRVKKRVGPRVRWADEQLSELISVRHELIHELGMDRSLTRERAVVILEFIRTVMELMVDHLEQRGTLVRR